jgi:hypothetical protein
LFEIKEKQKRKQKQERKKRKKRALNGPARSGYSEERRVCVGWFLTLKASNRICPRRPPQIGKGKANPRRSVLFGLDLAAVNLKKHFGYDSVI